MKLGVTSVTGTPPTGTSMLSNGVTMWPNGVMIPGLMLTIGVRTGLKVPTTGLMTHNVMLKIGAKNGKRTGRPGTLNGRTQLGMSLAMVPGTN